MATQPNKGKYNPPRKLMPGAPLPSLQQRNMDARVFSVARGQEFTAHLRHYLTDVQSTQSGARGIHLNKLDRNDEFSHAYIYEVEGTPHWGHGMDYDTGTSGGADYVTIFCNSSNAGKGADNFRFSREADAPAGTSQTIKWNLGRIVGSPRANSYFGTIAGGDNTTGLGGLELTFYDASATFPALHLANRSSAVKRTMIDFNGQYLVGTDQGNSNAQEFAIYDKVLPGLVFDINSAGLVTHYYQTQCNNTVTITAPSSTRCLVCNHGAGGEATVKLANAADGTNRTLLNQAGLFQWGTDLGFNGSKDFFFQNLTTGNAVIYCDVNDRVTIGSTNASGGAILGKSGGYASCYEATPITQPSGSSDILASLVSFGLRGASSNPPLNMGSGVVTCGNIATSGTIAMSGTQVIQGAGGNGVSFRESVPSPPTDADYTLSSAEAAAFIVVAVQGAWLSGHNFILPATTGGVWMINNLTTFNATFKTSGGTGVTLATNKTALVWCNGTNIIQMTAAL